MFPVVPFKGTFVKDRDAAGIQAADYRGRTFSAHSARKYFSTALTAAGVPEKMVDRLMRHAGRVEHRYYDPSLAEQAAAAAKLPRLWPDSGDICANRQAGGGPNVENSNPELTSRGRIAEDGPGTPVGSPDQPISTERPGPVFQPPECQRSAVFTGLGRQVESLMRAAGQGRPEQAAGRLTPHPVCMPNSAFSVAYRDGIETDDLADLFEALARLLRTRSSGHEGRTEASRPESNH